MSGGMNKAFESSLVLQDDPQRSAGFLSIDLCITGLQGDKSEKDNVWRPRKAAPRPP
jgi:hypothetical protein